jgi:CheY-like chemotaxis protein
MLRGDHQATARFSRPLRVLLAEDHDELRELVARELEADGAVVECVADGQAATNRLLVDRWRPDVVVTDVRMPGKSGVDVLRAIRAAGLTIPVIAVTAFGDAASRDEVEAFGGAVLLEKPFDFDDLRTALSNLPSIARLRCR